MTIRFSLRQRTDSPTRSDFELSLMPKQDIHRRELYGWSVHKSLTTNNWVATLSRPDSEKPDKTKFTQLVFSDEKEARRFCRSFAPPKMSSSNTCQMCGIIKPRHCKNCGVTVCDNCSVRWGSRMVPRTYISTPTTTIRACKACDWLSNAFCLALLRGKENDAVELIRTGNVNLRTSFADIHREAMFPIHCAIMGGSLELVRLLVDVYRCPISINQDNKGQILSVQTSSGRTLMDLAMSGKTVKADILSYLISKGLSVQDAKDKSLAPSCLEAILQAGPMMEASMPISNIHVVEEEECDGSMTTIEDPCAICCEKSMDCVLTPCGHQICCSTCGEKLQQCPVCKTNCKALRIYRS